MNNNTKQKLKETSIKIDSIMRNRLVIALFSIIDGISFLIFSGNSIPKMVNSIIIFVIIASGSTLITNMVSKEKDKKTIAISLATIIFSLSAFLFPKIIISNLKLILALFIISNGTINILNVMKFNKISAEIIEKENIVKNKVNHNKDFEQEIRKQTNKIINTFNNVTDRVYNIPHLYVILNLISISLGVFLLINPDLTVTIWGIIFIYSGLTDLIMTARSMNLTTKIKERINNSKMSNKHRKE